jgi:hypothetical protein
MVNFRFHLVSIVAVFLALGVGILMGSTVIDQATVRQLRRNIEGFRTQRDDARRLAADRRAELERWERFASEVQPELFAGRLDGVRVLVVSTEGVPGDLLDRVHAWLGAAGATDLGTLRLTDRFALAGDGAVRDLAAAVGSSATRPDAVRSDAIDALAASLVPPPDTSPPAASPDPEASGAPEGPATTAPATTAPRGGALFDALRRAGFVEHQPLGGPLDLGAALVPGTRLVVVGGSGGSLDDRLGTIPLCRRLARIEGAPVVAAEAGAAPGEPGPFVRALRADRTVADRISTVDDLDRFFGLVALVLAVEDLASGTTGHYGLAADRLVPAPNA